MSGFVLHPSALTDLDEIWDFIAADNLTAADRVLEELFEVMSSLASFPRMAILARNSHRGRCFFIRSTVSCLFMLPMKLLCRSLRYSTGGVVLVFLLHSYENENEIT